MGLDFDVLAFCKKLRQNRPPPYQCPLEKCDRVYKSLCGLQYHLVNYDHKNPTPLGTAPLNRKKGWRMRAAVPTGDIALQIPPKEALTFSEAHKVVQFEIEGQVIRISIDEPLSVISLEEWAKRNATLEKPINFVEPPPEPNVGLPEPNYKLISDYNISDAPPRPNAYIRFIEKSPEEHDGEVEYDVDEEDTAWLDLLNKTRAQQTLPAVSVDTLELLMDRLEKESYFQSTQTRENPSNSVDEDAVCCICMDGECQNTNVILFCDMCNLAVHQDCYGVPYIPEGQWLCRRCLQSPSRLVDCVLCPNTEGAFKQTDQGRWAHVVCALWIPEVRFANTVFLEPIDSIETIPAARWRLTCYVCRQRGKGACIQCHKIDCFSAFHVTCAQQAGLYMEMQALSRGNSEAGQPVHVTKKAYCNSHTPLKVLRDQKNSSSNDVLPPLLVRKNGRDKLRQARRTLAQQHSSYARNGAPIAVVTLAAERVAEIAAMAGGGVAGRAHLVRRLLAYWTLKRHHRNGAPLLRRLQTLTNHHSGRGFIPGSTVDTRELCNQLKYWQRIRQDLERARLLCELVRKRERLKTEWTRVWESVLLQRLRPSYAALRKLLSQLRTRDTSGIFSEPVDPSEVPDYSLVVSRPMDLSTMARKVEWGEYRDLDELEDDFHLMIDNCLAYNTEDTVFHKAGLKMREQCVGLIRSARRDMRAAGLPQAGHREDAPQPPPQPILGRRRSLSVSRKRAHHRTDDEIESARSSAGDTPAQSSSVARGRGRPRRHTLSSHTNQSNDKVSGFVTRWNQSGGSEIDFEPLIPRKATSKNMLPSKSTESSCNMTANLPTLSASMSRTSSSRPARGRNRRGRPRKADLPTHYSIDSVSGSGGISGVPASFLHYRGPPGEAGSDSDATISRCSSSLSASSCSSCLHPDDDMSDSCTSTCDGSSCNDSMDSNTNQRLSDTRRNFSDFTDTGKTHYKGRPPALRPLQLVWAKCRGYPWYPALIMDPDIPKGYIHCGVPLPVPPRDVLALQHKATHAHTHRHLVLFFDTKRTWQWLPADKLEPLGLQRPVDQAKLVESRKPADRKAVKKAYNEAVMYKSQVDQ